MQFRQFSGQFKIALGIAAALGTLTVVPTAPAQAQDDGASGVLEEIMVTARRREENLQELKGIIS